MKKAAVFTMALLLALAIYGAALAAEAPRGYLKGEGYQYYRIGVYPQGKNGEVEPLLWRALAVEDSKTLLLTEYVIDAQQVIFEDDEETIKAHTYRRIESFADSDLCTWMNTAMLPAIFGNDILQSALVAGEYGLLYPPTDDQLLQAEYGFSSARYGVNPLRRAEPTTYAVSVGAYRDRIGTTPYWVANVKAAEGYKLQIVGYDGHLSYGAYTRRDIGIRPAMTLDLSQCAFTGGDGSMDNPFQITFQPAATEVPTATPTASAGEGDAAVSGNAQTQAEAQNASEAPDTQTLSTDTAVLEETQATAGSDLREPPADTQAPAVPVETDMQIKTAEPTAEAATAVTTTAVVTTAETSAETDEAATVATLSLIGDCSIGDAYQYRNREAGVTGVIAQNGPDWLFSLVSSYLKADDLTAANLEVTLTDSKKHIDIVYPLVAKPENVAVLTQGGIDVVNTVNNHCFDFGTQGYDDTLATLDAADIAHFGNAIRGGKDYSALTAIVDVKGIRFGFTGFSYPQDQTLTEIGEQIQALRAAGCDVVIVSLHWGRETYSTPNSGQPAYAARIIDLGADVVWGHHPHVLQPIQFYQGKPVFFSTGNFVFGTMSKVDPSTGIFQLQYEKTADGVKFKSLTVIPCKTQGSRDYRPYEVTDEAEREAVWGILRSKKTYEGYVNLPEEFTETGTVEAQAVR